VVVALAVEGTVDSLVVDADDEEVCAEVEGTNGNERNISSVGCRRRP
jgi:hypothetical protein